MDYSNFEKYYKNRRHLPLPSLMFIHDEDLEDKSYCKKNLFMSLFNEWIDEKYAEHYLGQRQDFSYMDDDFCIIKSFPSNIIIKILQYHGYNYGSWPTFAFVSDVAKYMYSVWKDYKNLGETKELLKLKRTIKFCKKEIKSAIQNMMSLNNKKEYSELLSKSREEYDYDVFGSCNSKYYKYRLYIYVPLLKNSESIITKILDIAFLDDAQEFLLWGLIKFDVNTLYRVTKNLILQLLSQKHRPREGDCCSCTFRTQSFDPFFGSQPGPHALRYCIAKLFRNGIYVLNDPEIVKACDTNYGEGCLIKNKYFGVLIEGNPGYAESESESGSESESEI